MSGKVFLVGAGPGDPELITRKGAALLRRAGCVIYDRLASPELLKLAKPRCEKIYAGKEADEKGKSQSRINRLLVEKASRHRTVVRLKGGDPALFGRLAEEMEALRANGVPFEVVPGVSSVWAAAAAVGIPLTDRRCSSSVAFVTGHRAAGRYPSVRWNELARGADTLVVLMGRAALSDIVRRLRQAGRPASMPIALVRWASTPAQQILVSNLGNINDDLKLAPEFGSPVVAVIGEVVEFAHKLVKNIIKVDRQDLKGMKILITRAQVDQNGLSNRLQELGAICRTLPTVQIRPARLSPAKTKKLVSALPSYDWLLFNSHHGVEKLERLAGRLGKKLSRLIRGKACAIGPRTKQAAQAAGLTVDLVPKEFSTPGVKKAFEKISLHGKRLLIPRSNLGMGDALARSLRKRGAQVDEVAVYETVELKIPAARLRRALHGLDAVTFTSASTVRSFLRALKAAKIPARKAFNGAAVVAIGPQTGKELLAGGIRRFSLPNGSWTVDGLVEAVRNAVRPSTSSGRTA